MSEFASASGAATSHHGSLGDTSTGTVAQVIGGLTPEQKARVEIDRKLEAAGWAVQDFSEMDLTVPERGIAVARVPDR